MLAAFLTVVGDYGGYCFLKQVSQHPCKNQTKTSRMSGEGTGTILEHEGPASQHPVQPRHLSYSLESETPGQVCRRESRALCPKYLGAQNPLVPALSG